MDKEEQEVKLPKDLEIQNIFLSMGSIASYALLPIFIYNSTKTVRDGRKINTPATLSFFNPLQGYSCADILSEACWKYGVPTQFLSLQYGIDSMGDKKYIGLYVSFAVPNSQAYYADIILHQKQGELFYMMTSRSLVNNGIPSHHYQMKKYSPQGVYAKPKSLDMMFGYLLFGGRLNVSKIKVKKDKVSMEMKNQTHLSKRTNHGKISNTTISKNKSAKLGKTYK